MVEKKIKEKILEIKEILNNEKIIGDSPYSIASGELGKLIFFFNFVKRFDDENLQNKSFEILGMLNTDINNSSNLKLSFINGFSGYCWFMSFFNKKFYELEKDFFSNGDTYNILKKFLEENLIENNYDYLHGAFGSYLSLNELKLDENKEIENLIVKYFNEIKIPTTNNKDEIKVNLGLSHGVPSLISILCISNKKNYANIIEKLTNYLLEIYSNSKKNKQEGNTSQSIFPNYISLENQNYDNSRLAWCYGDLGIAISIWQSGKALNIPKFKSKAIEILIYNSKRRDLLSNSVVDAGLCHGTAGIAHIFNRFYKETGLIEFNEARWYWLEQTLLMAKFEDGLAGYKSWQGDYGWKNDYGLLEGIAGIGLSLLGFLTDDVNDLEWDRCLLLS